MWRRGFSLAGLPVAFPGTCPVRPVSALACTADVVPAGPGNPPHSPLFDLLLLLIEERQRAVSRQEIFDRVWADVVVSDGALTRRDPDDPANSGMRSASQFIRTVSRHGYQFVAAEVLVESDEGPVLVRPELAELPAVSRSPSWSPPTSASAC